MSRQQLMAYGLSRAAIAHRIASGRLHPVGRGVYAVGRPRLGTKGRWMAAVLGCGATAVLSHYSAAALWGIAAEHRGVIEVSVRTASPRRRKGIKAYRRPGLSSAEVTRRDGIPVTTAVCTLVDLAGSLSPARLEAAINEADRLDRVDIESLRAALERFAGRRGVAVMRKLLDSRTFRLTRSELERRFLRIVRGAGLPTPETGRYVNGFQVDFFWTDLGLVVETDGLRYHRTPAQQARDRLRDQAHAAAGLTPLRFTHAQVRFEAGYVQATLIAVTERLRRHHGALSRR